MTSSTSSFSTAQSKIWPPFHLIASSLNSHVNSYRCSPYAAAHRIIFLFFFILKLCRADIFALVTYLPAEDGYRFHMYSEESVPLFGPSLPSTPIFSKAAEFREFLLVKCEFLCWFHSPPLPFLALPCPSLPFLALPCPSLAFPLSPFFSMTDTVLLI